LYDGLEICRSVCDGAKSVEETFEEDTLPELNGKG
jgi:hypothetical protein